MQNLKSFWINFQSAESSQLCWSFECSSFSIHSSLLEFSSKDRTHPKQNKCQKKTLFAQYYWPGPGQNIRAPSSRILQPYYCQSKLNPQSGIFKDFPLLLKHIAFHGKVWNNLLISTHNVYSCIWKTMSSTFSQKGNKYHLCKKKKAPSVVGNENCLYILCSIPEANICFS